MMMMMLTLQNTVSVHQLTLTAGIGQTLFVYGRPI